jgi:hypothetical protein
MLTGKPQETGGAASRHRQQAFLSHRRRCPQFGAQFFDDREQRRRVSRQHRTEVRTVELECFGRLDGNRIGRSRLTVERGDLARDIAGAEEIEHDLTRIDGCVCDLDAAADDDDQAVAGVASPVDRFPRGDADHAASLHQLRQRLFRKCVEDGQGFEEGAARLF